MSSAAIRLPIVGVMGSGAEPSRERAVALGRSLAGLGVHLLTGGGGGVMAAVSQAFFEVASRKGSVIGILPSCEGSSGSKPGYPNPWVEIPIFTHLPLSGERGTHASSRNHINVLSSNVVVALPGGAGTLSEIALALRYERPIIGFLESRREIPGLPSQVQVEGRIEAVLDFVRTHLS